MHLERRRRRRPRRPSSMQNVALRFVRCGDQGWALTPYRQHPASSPLAHTSVRVQDHPLTAWRAGDLLGRCTEMSGSVGARGSRPRAPSRQPGPHPCSHPCSHPSSLRGCLARRRRLAWPKERRRSLGCRPSRRPTRAAAPSEWSCTGRRRWRRRDRQLQTPGRRRDPRWPVA